MLYKNDKELKLSKWKEKQRKANVFFLRSMISQNFEGNCPKVLIVDTSWACSVHWVSHHSPYLSQQSIIQSWSSYGHWQVTHVHWTREFRFKSRWQKRERRHLRQRAQDTGGSEGKEEGRTRVLQGPGWWGGSKVLTPALKPKGSQELQAEFSSLLGRHPGPGQQDPHKTRLSCFSISSHIHSC